MKVKERNGKRKMRNTTFSFQYRHYLKQLRLARERFCATKTYQTIHNALNCITINPGLKYDNTKSIHYLCMKKLSNELLSSKFNVSSECSTYQSVSSEKIALKFITGPSYSSFRSFHSYYISRIYFVYTQSKYSLHSLIQNIQSPIVLRKSRNTESMLGSSTCLVCLTCFIYLFDLIHLLKSFASSTYVSST